MKVQPLGNDPARPYLEGVPLIYAFLFFRNVNTPFYPAELFRLWF
jgi:hypothetical protein